LLTAGAVFPSANKLHWRAQLSLAIAATKCDCRSHDSPPLRILLATRAISFNPKPVATVRNPGQAFVVGSEFSDLLGGRELGWVESLAGEFPKISNQACHHFYSPKDIDARGNQTMREPI
jgi:hypothetical protein